jgi:hypothetical protein
MNKSENNPLEKSNGSLPDFVQQQTQSILTVWKDNRRFELKETKFEDFEKISCEYDKVVKDIETRIRELHELRTTRWRLVSKVGKMASRVRLGMQGYFGPQSPEYSRVRLPHSKKPAPKVKKPHNRMNMLRHLESQRSSVVPSVPAKPPVPTVPAVTPAMP